MQVYGAIVIQVSTLSLYSFQTYYLHFLLFLLFIGIFYFEINIFVVLVNYFSMISFSLSKLCRASILVMTRFVRCLVI